MVERLRVGVIGLGTRWRKRYRPALLTLHQRFRILAVCDQVQQRAMREARRLGCTAVAGPAQLLEDDALDALLLLDPQWFGLWPLELACRAGKPVFCCCPLELDDAHADALHQQIAASGLPVVMEMAPRFTPVMTRLADLLASELGSPRLQLWDVRVRTGTWPGPGPSAVLGAQGVALLDSCLRLMGSSPSSLLALGGERQGWSGLLLKGKEEQTIQILHYRAPAGPPGVQFRIVTEHGQTSGSLPRRVSWTKKDGRHRHTLLGERSLGVRLLERFHEFVEKRLPPDPSFGDACGLLKLLRLAAQSRAEGRQLVLS